MTQDLGNPEEATRPSPPPCTAPAITEARVGYHRLFLAMSIVVLCACVVLPAPNTAGEMRLPGFGSSLPTLCMLKREFGVDCPGCGLTRCFVSMGHGQVASAWAYHPIGIAFFALLVAQIPFRLYQIQRLRRGRPELAHWTQWALLWLLVVALLGQWILRITGILTA
jgi:uncharacterized protein DUF2752